MTPVKSKDLPPWFLEDESNLSVLLNRYMGQMDTLDLTDRATRDQLCLDLGMLMGMVARLLDDVRRLRGLV